jgi:glyoxylase-like metal-dependent hydrolase (beta-lactamase superfamily II)
MKIHKVEPGAFKLDGGATFGVVPKTLWSKVYPADEKNLCWFSLRNLLIETDNRLILIDTGIGNKQDDTFYKHYYRSGHHSITRSIKDLGYTPDQVTDVILTHLHFDHVGDAVSRNAGGEFVPTFANATYHISKRQWEWAVNPNQREKASYLNENIFPLLEAGVINFIEMEGELLPGIDLRMFHGHTDGLLIPIITYKGNKLVYTADFIPLAAQISASWVCGYDTRPLISFEEKKIFLKEAVEKGYKLIFQHDYYTEGCTLKQTEKGIKMDAIFKLEEIV